MSEQPTQPPTGLDDDPEDAGTDECSVCLDFDWAEWDAERMGDPSAATDWRVLRRRHEAAEHPTEARIPSADPTDPTGPADQTG
ncbi:hypothetical protein [Streptomyces sp. NBC_00102]|uniref:hypothetical protein n=1 Tax=Streptomyces sp. NBC_00102 TaxID=2975652 RepID=UPI002250960E|nr:hypothetical protein [Streptomyces sp. NBC_00102]MCX5397810.1 hypothetical protein [Streptomyces sp. NBC_00102]